MQVVNKMLHVAIIVNCIQ